MEEFSRLKSMYQKLADLRLNGDFCDVNLEVRGKKFFGHKVVLAACSRYFEAMFLTSMHEKNQYSISLYDICPDVFSELLDFSYGKTLEIDSKTVEDIVIAADMLQFTDAIEICVRFMKSQLDCTNCTGIYCFAKQHAFKDLEKTAWEFMQSHFYQIISEDEFLNLPFDVLTNLVKSEHIAIESELDVMCCVIRWISHDVHQRRKHCVSLLKNVRINLIPSKEIDNILYSISDICLKIAVKVLTGGGKSFGGKSGSSESFHQKFDPDKSFEPRQSAKKGFYAIGGCVPKSSRRYTWEANSMDAVSFIERFDSFSQTWDPYPLSLREARTNLAAVAVNGKIYSIGGERDSMIYGSMECFDTLLKQWKWDLPSLCVPRCSCQAVATDTDIYIIGGFVGTGAGNSIERYNIETNACEIVNFTMQTERHSFGAVCVDNVIYMAGGVGLSECEMRTVECYDLDRHEWWFANDMTFKRAYFNLVFLKGFIYAIGGHNDIQGTLKSVEMYDRFKNAWKLCSPMKQARAGAFVSVMDQKIVVVGGKVKSQNLDGEAIWDVLHTAEIYDPKTNTWNSMDRCNFDARCDGVALVV
uniref:actin-binding protein IPP-like n=1 Tax=Styela clava TaxID=7725 RepID=UPI00193A0EFF|nr:actin-binding protein IPP-like [Styela clava]